MDWKKNATASRPTFVLDADSRYTVMQWGLGSWQAYYHGNRINPDHLSLGSRSAAQALAEEHRNSPERRIERAQEIIIKFGGVPGERHRAWVIRSISAVLVGLEPDFDHPDAP